MAILGEGRGEFVRKRDDFVARVKREIVGHS
jgi:hypothetical protein